VSDLFFISIFHEENTIICKTAHKYD